MIKIDKVFNIRKGGKLTKEDFEYVFKNKFFKSVLIVGGSLFVFYLSGKVARIVATTIVDYKFLKAAIKR